jgi:hypothetical protein
MHIAFSSMLVVISYKALSKVIHTQSTGGILYP